MPLHPDPLHPGSYGSANVSVIGTTNNSVIGGPIAVGSNPIALAVTPRDRPRPSSP
jgi:DNA-binding beta-propeller fold protein YncE